MRNKLAVLGAGNMGLAIVDGIISSGVLSPSDIILVRRNTDKLSAYAEKGCTVSNDLLWAAENADVLLLALKPQMMADLFELIGKAAEGKLAISIAAGIKKLSPLLKLYCLLLKIIFPSPSVKVSISNVFEDF